MIKKAKAEYVLFEAPLPVSSTRRNIQVDIDHYLTLLNEAMGNGMAEALGNVIRNLAAHSDQIEGAVVVWVRLIEVLVQNAERSGASGKLKKSDVKAAAHYLIQDRKLDVPQVPFFLQAVILDFVVDWLIEVIVEETNQYGLWTEEPPEPTSFMSIVRMAVKRVMNWCRPILEFLARAAARIAVVFRYTEPLTPEVKLALEAVERQGFLLDKRDAMRIGVETAVFIGQHGEQVIAIFRLAFEAVRDAERFSEMSGPEKKQYAEDVILTVLDDLGFPVDNGVIGAIIRSLTGAAIESAVDIFSRREPEFFHHHPETAAGLPAGNSFGDAGRH
jgi:hypothetical protein